MTIRCAALCLLWLCALPALAQAGNVLVLVADDMGVDMLQAYGEAGACSGSLQQCFAEDDCPAAETCVTDYPLTPHIDSLADDGILFRNAWVAPLCSPTRAMLHTGRHGFRTGVFRAGATGTLPEDELTLPEILDSQPLAAPYRHAAIGKWHLRGGDSGPNDQGFGHYAGPLSNIGGSYFDWQRTENGLTRTCSAGSNACPESSYVTTVNVDDALAWLAGRSAPWYLWVGFTAPHGPFHVPPHHLVSAPTLARLPTDGSGAPASPGTACNGSFRRACYLAAIEAMDAEIGRLLAAVPSDTTVFFLGDNGSPRGVTREPFNADRAKSTLYEGGVNVPFIVRHPGSGPRGVESAALVHAVDIVPTVLELAAARLPEDGRVRDGLSLLPLLAHPNAPFRAHAYTEDDASQAVRDGRFKLIRRAAYDELYDLLLDPFERDDRLQGVCQPDTATTCHLDSDCEGGGTCDLPALTPLEQQAVSRLHDAILDRLNGASRIPRGGPGVPGEPLQVVPAADGRITLTWSPACAPEDTDYGIYEGVLGDFNSHQPVTCSTGGASSATFVPGAGSHYYLVVPQNGTREGSYGHARDQTPRRPSSSPCLPAAYGGCD